MLQVELAQICNLPYPVVYLTSAHGLVCHKRLCYYVPDCHTWVQRGVGVLEHHLNLGSCLLELFLVQLKEIHICLVGKVVDDFSCSRLNSPQYKTAQSSLA